MVNVPDTEVYVRFSCDPLHPATEKIVLGNDPVDDPGDVMVCPVYLDYFSDPVTAARALAYLANSGVGWVHQTYRLSEDGSCALVSETPGLTEDSVEGRVQIRLHEYAVRLLGVLRSTHPVTIPYPVAPTPAEGASK